MNTKQMLGLIGSIVLFIGVFTPIVSVPILGNMNYFQNGEDSGRFVLVLAVISLILVLAKKYKGLWFTGIGSLGIMLFSFRNFQSLHWMAMQSVQLQWGCALLIVGAALVIASAAMKDEAEENR